MVFDCFSYTSVGGRNENQDAIKVIEGETNGIFIVADGLGGHRLGNLASQAVAAAMEKEYDDKKKVSREQLSDSIQKANEAVISVQKDNHCSAKSTVAVLEIQEKTAIWANVGDSRVYYIHNGDLESVTEDHSVAYKKYKSGEIKKEEIAKDEDQSSLLRSLGHETRWKPNLYDTETLFSGDGFLLCSDGLWEYNTDEEILESFLKSETAEQWAKRMIQRVEQRAEKDNDNYSVIAIRLV
jgi:serine/threonine protein phosphatase PrpC